MQETKPMIWVRQYLAAAPNTDDPNTYQHRVKVEFAGGQFKTFAVVELDRFERLREYVDADLSLNSGDGDIDDAYERAQKRLVAALDALILPGDLDPLP